MITSHSIRSGVLGVRDTLALMLAMAQSGSRLTYVDKFVRSIPLRQWETVLREYWDYQEEQDETLRSVQTQVETLMKTNKLVGDCDDAAIVAGAMCEAAHLPWKFVTVRPPDNTEFSHVFVEVFKGDWLRLDPTAPVDADYTTWERMVYP